MFIIQRKKVDITRQVQPVNFDLRGRRLVDVYTYTYICHDEATLQSFGWCCTTRSFEVWLYHDIGALKIEIPVLCGLWLH